MRHRLEIVLKELLQLHCLTAREVFWALEETPAGVFHDWLVTVLLQASRLTGTDLVDRLVEQLHDVASIQDVHRGTRLSRDNFEVWSPHVAADKREPLRAFLTQHDEKPFEAGDCTVLADPQEPLDSLVNLVNQGQVLVPSPPQDLVDPDSRDSLEAPVGQPPVHNRLDRTIDRTPGGPEDLRNLLPRHAPRPGRQKVSVAIRQVVLPGRPRAIAPP